MLTIADIPMLVLLPALLVASAFFSGSETALFTLSAHQRLRLQRTGDMFGGAASTLLAETRSLLITLLLGNMTINVLYFAVSTVLLLRIEERGAIGPAGVTIASVLTLMIIILAGEIAPKMVAARVPVTWSRAFCLPLLIIHRILGPLRLVLNAGVITPLARLIAPQQRPEDLSPDELEALLKMSEEQGIIAPEEERQLQQVLTLGQIKVRALMTHRVAIEALDLSDPVPVLIEKIRHGRFSRYPVYRGSLDDVVGIVIARQVLLHEPTNVAELRPLIRQVNFVPEQQRADQLLVQFRKSGTTLALVVDEYGGTAGLITLEDAVEQMVGDITDDTEGAAMPEVEALGEGVYRVRAELPVHEWLHGFRRRDIAAGAAAADVSTIGGLMMARLGRLPREGDAVRVGNVDIEVDQMQGPRLRWLRVHLVDDTQRREATA